MFCNKVLLWELLDNFDNDLDNNFENNAQKLEHNVDELQEILNRIMQGIANTITSAPTHWCDITVTGGSIDWFS